MLGRFTHFYDPGPIYVSNYHTFELNLHATQWLQIFFNNFLFFSHSRQIFSIPNISSKSIIMDFLCGLVAGFFIFSESSMLTGWVFAEDVEIMVDLGILVPRKFLRSQKIFREMTTILSRKWNSCKNHRYFYCWNGMFFDIRIVFP